RSHWVGSRHSRRRHVEARDRQRPALRADNHELAAERVQPITIDLCGVTQTTGESTWPQEQAEAVARADQPRRGNTDLLLPPLSVVEQLRHLQVMRLVC